MRLTVEDLREVVKEAVKKMADMEWEPHEIDPKKTSWASAMEPEEGSKRGKGGYEVDEDSPVQPKGFARTASGDFSDQPKGGRLARQGVANMGPYTSESAVRAIVRQTVDEQVRLRKMKREDAKRHAPYSSVAEVGKKGSVGNPRKNFREKASRPLEAFDRWYMKKNESVTRGSLLSQMGSVLSERGRSSR